MLLTPCHNLSISAGGQCLCPLVVFVSLTFVSHLCSSLDSEGATERICVLLVFVTVLLGSDELKEMKRRHLFLFHLRETMSLCDLLSNDPGTVDLSGN